MLTHSLNTKILLVGTAAMALASAGLYAAFCIHEQQEHHRVKRALAVKVEVCGQSMDSTPEAAARWSSCASEQFNDQPASGINPQELKQWLESEDRNRAPIISTDPTATLKGTRQ